MSLALCTQIAQAITDALNSGEFSQTFTARRVYVPSYELSKLPGLQVFVLATAQAVDLSAGTREYSLDSYTVSVALYKQVSRDANGQPNPADVDALLYLVDELKEWAKGSSPSGAAVVRIINSPVYDPGQLDTNNTFVSVLTLDYQLLR